MEVSLLPTDPQFNDDPWYRRMLGPTSLSWQAIIFAGILNFPQMVLTGGNLGARTVQPGEYPTIAAVSAATILASFAYGYLGHITLFRNRHVKPVSLRTFLGFYAGGGVLYSLGIQVSDYVSGSPSSIPFALRAIDAALVSIAWGIAVSLILEGRLRFRTERDALIGEILEEIEQTQEQGALIAQGQASVTRAINAELERHLTEIQVANEDRRQARESTSAVHDLARRIDTAADVGARESSHRAWEESVRSTAVPRFGRTLRTALTTPRVWPAPMGVLVAIGVPTVAVRNFGLWWGLPATVALGAVSWLWMRAVKHRITNNWLAFVLSFFGTAAAVGAFAVLPAPDTPQAFAEIGSIVVGLIGGFLLVSFIATLQSERQEVLMALKEDVLLREAERLAQARAVAQVARRLHGPVQTRLRICAAEIERAADRGDSRGIDTAVEVALRTLAEVTEREQVAQPLSVALSDVAKTWTGFVDVDLHLDETAASLIGRNDIVEVVNEAIANAHHHGQATSASVMLEGDNDAIHLHVLDNGSATVTGEPGLGTRLLRSAAESFELSVTREGARLDVVFPLVEKQTLDPRI